MVIDHFTQDSHQTKDTVVYVYIRGEDTELRHSLDQVISMLIKQLCWNLETLPIGSLEYYRQCNKDARPPVLDRLTAMFMECVGCLNRVFVVLDGLDEFEGKYRRPLLDFICEASKLNNAKILVASRWEWDIERALSRVNALNLWHLDSKGADIEKVVRHRVKKDLGHIKRDIQEDIIQQLVEKSSGV